MLLPRAPGIRIRDVTATCGITERTAQRIVTGLEAAGHVRRKRVGRPTGTPSTATGGSGTRWRRACAWVCYWG
ncbi:helix-turn-helix domain-containing protein [Streptomyces hundungensis]|uniref:helix-turn-helix domain-containing protein n=1 Tax=Streptomyces hundungensis TaxID=1077946 RepID=UPI00340FDE44